MQSATVSWSAPSSNGGSPVTGYQVQVSPATAGASISVNGTTASVGGLSNGTAYIFRISAVNAVGTGAASAPSSAVTTPDVPGAPTGVTAQAGDRSATLSWSAPSSNGGSPITGYRISISPTASGATISVNGTTASIGGLTNGTTYTFRVSALNAVGTGAASAPSAAVTPAPRSSPRRG